MFRRAAWGMWFPPMAKASPSPIVTAIVSSGRETFIPTATRIARP